MSLFSTTVLGPHSAAFRGRANELERLVRLCREDTRKYGVLYGGRQNGKTSLLLQLETALSRPTRVCRIDFQQIQGAPSARAFAHLATRIRAILPSGDSSPVSDGPTFQAFLHQALAAAEIPRLVLLLDELGALPAATREELGNALRSVFTDRLVLPPLAKLQIIFSGGIELYDMVVSEVSSLHSVCEEIYLPDLAERDAITLIADGLREVGVAAALGEAMGQAVYQHVVGHPYLTQRIGELLEEWYMRGDPLTIDAVQSATQEIQSSGLPLLRRIRADLREQKLEDAAKQLLSNPPRFTRLNDEMARLELIGLAKPTNGLWAVRNPLLASSLGEFLGIAAPVPAPTPTQELPRTPETTPFVSEADSQAIITAKQRRLSALELTAARYGIDCPPHVTIEIEDLRREIAVLQRSTTPKAQGNTPANKPVTLPAWVPELVKIPAGRFLMGSSDADPQSASDEKPQHTLELPDYWIGKTPITNAQFRFFVDGDGYRNQTYWTNTGWQWRESEKVMKPAYWDNTTWNGADYPVVGVSWFEAVAYCCWLSAKTGYIFLLPTEAEWEKAARGPQGLIWPWGNTWAAGRCNSAEASIGKTTPVEHYPSGASPYGALDMAGNVWEWCTTQVGKRYPYQLEDEWQAKYLATNQNPIFRGGAYYSEQNYVRGAYRISSRNPRNRYDNRGLRVASHSPS
jgi:formylglycine-generating enzyme required for sulfatase activity